MISCDPIGQVRRPSAPNGPGGASSYYKNRVQPQIGWPHPVMFTGIIIIFVSAFTLYFYNSRRSTLPLPPGPPPKFFTGNAHQLPKQGHWWTFNAWAESYGSST
jgi:hypothetical protein